MSDLLSQYPARQATFSLSSLLQVESLYWLLYCPHLARKKRVEGLVGFHSNFVNGGEQNKPFCNSMTMNKMEIEMERNISVWSKIFF